MNSSAMRGPLFGGASRAGAGARLLAIAAGACALWAAGGNGALGQGKQPDMKIDAATRKEVVEGAIRYLNEGYVFPDVAKKMETLLRDRMKQGAYDTVASASSLSQLLTDDLRSISNDKHLFLGYSSEPIPMRQGVESTAEEEANYRALSTRLNFGFEKLERMPGNIGYIDLRSFTSATLGAETAIAAMNFLSNTSALIIDLRKNGGGDPAMVALISSYLFPEDPVHLNSLYNRPSDKTQQWWTLPYVPGKRYGNKDVYILTSNETFSAAEEFTYNLKSLKRATIIGETTGGGAHPGGTRPITPHFFIWVPSGRAINPVTGTNWEGTGVAPDLDVPAVQALKTAYLMALRKEAEKAEATDKPLAAALRDLVARTEKELEELKRPAGNSYSVPGDK